MARRIGVAVLLAGALLATAAAAQGSKVTLRVADHYPTNASTANYTIKFFMDTVRQASGGSVDFEYYPSEQLGKARDMLALTQQGVTDIGFVAPAYVSDKMPLSAVAELPGTYTGSCQAVDGILEACQGRHPGRAGVQAERHPAALRLLAAALSDHDAAADCRRRRRSPG